MKLLFDKYLKDIKGKITLLMCSLVLFNFFLKAQNYTDTLSVLFVGNSYTYYQNLPHIVSLISDSTSIKLETRKSTAAGANLSHHWNGERGLKTRTIIEEGNFDVVVLQDHSWGPIKASVRFEEYASMFCQLIKDSGAEPYFYITWARDKVPHYQEVLNKTYIEVAEHNAAKLAPVGPGWEYAKKLRPNIDLYTADGSHPNDLGTFLTACIFIGAITGDYPASLPLRYYTKDAHGESVELLRMDDLDMQFCMEVAKAVVVDFNYPK